MKPPAPPPPPSEVGGVAGGVGGKILASSMGGHESLSKRSRREKIQRSMKARLAVGNQRHSRRTRSPPALLTLRRTAVSGDNFSAGMDIVTIHTCKNA